MLTARAYKGRGALGVQGDQTDVAALSTGRLVAADAAVVVLELETRTRGRVDSVLATTAAEARRQTREWCAPTHKAS